MGNYISRILSHDSEEKHNVEIAETAEQSNLDKECDYSSTNQQLLTDPRSITTEIYRTPIKINPTSPNNTRMIVDVLTKNMKKPYLETNFDSTMSPSTLNNYLDPRSPIVNQPRTPISVDNLLSCKTPTLGIKNNTETLPLANLKHIESFNYDPRSPSTDFNRTPINIEITKKYLQTESEENEEGLCSKTNNHPRYLFCETTSSDTPEILAVVDETCEAIKSLQFNHSDSETKLRVSDNVNHMNNENVNNHITYNTKNSQNRDLTSINRIKIWKDSELSENLEQFEINENNDKENDEEKFSCPSKEEIEVIFDDDDNIIKRNKSISEQLTITTEDEIKDVQDTSGDKKKVKTSKKTPILYNKNINKISKKRTPLGNRCNNAQLDTVLTNSPQNVLQKKNCNNLIQCENTPPHKKSYDKSKYNGIKWDINSTVII
ncbi:PREDICTED: uncharacterized protein DDB_G0287625-like [Polistes dominula]|uniref:Uncharacterized protein DDB_G0287625-like n=1 Tax=Polistes dominula TaxID=743375 RepID=A0ABM1IMC2_POLDO|nr:PREDICTED: uncharacterized protein DDB_G0287625-like [Polistes dominula]